MTRLGTAATAGVALLAAGACDSGGGNRGGTNRTPGHDASGSTGASPPSAGTTSAVDQRLRERAIDDERRLLRACAAPAGVEPFATLRSVHRDHLRALTGRAVPDVAATAQPLPPQTVATAEASAAVARRTDCGSASTALAPLLASLAASGSVAAALLTP